MAHGPVVSLFCFFLLTNFSKAIRQMVKIYLTSLEYRLNQTNFCMTCQAVLRILYRLVLDYGLITREIQIILCNYVSQGLC